MKYALTLTVNTPEGLETEIEGETDRFSEVTGAATAMIAGYASEFPDFFKAPLDGAVPPWSSLVIVVTPIEEAAAAPTNDNDLGGRMPGHDKNGNYSTAQMLADEAHGGDTTKPLDD